MSTCTQTHTQLLSPSSLQMPAMTSGWARLKLGARNTIQVAGPNYLRIICCLPGRTLAGSWNQQPKLGLKPRYSDNTQVP